jgi:TRAP transporter 4TM/12TM fusion protein
LVHTPNGQALKASTDAEKYDFSAQSRDLVGWQKAAIGFLCVAYSAFHLLILNFVALDAWVFRAIHVNLAAVIALSLYSMRPGARSHRIAPIDLALSLGAVAAVAYIWWNLNELIVRTGVLMTAPDVVIATIGILVVIEFARRTAGLALPILACVFILYGFLGPYLPGVLYHRGYGFDELTTFVYSLEGVFGITTAAAAQYIILFVTFAAFLQVSKVGNFFMDLAFGAMGWARGGPAKVSLLGSILFGMVSGSGVANVVASGTFTIPVMKKSGYRPSSAGAIEAAASTGGQLTPPIMGAGAFIMAEVTGIPYTEIIVAALIPCLLYYFAVYVHIDIEARRERIEGLPRSELPALRPMLREGFILLPLAVLLVFLFANYSIISAGSWGIAAAVLVMLLHRVQLDTAFLSIPLAVLIGTVILVPGLSANTHGAISLGSGLVVILCVAVWKRARMIPQALFGTGEDMLGALGSATRQALQLAAVCACAGVVVGMIGLTGLGGRFSALLLGVAGQSEFLALVFAMLIALILGMGMPTTAAYAIAASVVAPSLQRLGLDVLSVHLFIFYYAVVSTITPPIALSAFAGAALAGANPWHTAFKSVRYGIAAFIVPFLFIYNQGILLYGTPFQIIHTTITAVLGVWGLAVASEGWLNGKLHPALRVILAAAALCLIAGDIYTDVIGLLVGGSVVAFGCLRERTTLGSEAD